MRPIQKFYQSQPPSEPPQILTFKEKNDAVTNTTQTLSGDLLTGKLDRVIEKENTKKNLVPEEDIIFTLPKLPIILDDEGFKKKQEIKKQQDNETKDEIDLNKLKKETDAGKIPEEIEPGLD